jgi:dTDP-4-dehydrorhamnose 3,5-epimerase-like enzyme
LKILDVFNLAVPEIQVIRFARFRDHRGFFTEHFRASDVAADTRLAGLHGVRFVQTNESFSRAGTVRGNTVIEYFCSGEYSQGCEAGISPISADIDWSLCDPALKATFDRIAPTTERMTNKDRMAPGVSAWANDPRSGNLVYGTL